MKHWILCHSDPDGYSSGAILYLYLTKLNGDWNLMERREDIRHITDLGKISRENIKVHPINYGQDLPDIDYKEDFVYVVDFSIQPNEQMKELYEKLGDRLIWIDHHKTSVEAEEEIEELKEIPGVRVVGDDNGLLAGCELTWKFFLDTDVPQIMQLIGDWDTWRHVDIPGSKAPEVINYMKSMRISPDNSAAINFWTDLIFDMMHLPVSFGDVREHEKKVIKIIDEGEIILRYVERDNEENARAISFEAVIEGHPAIVMNSGKGPNIFDSVYNEERHDIKASFSCEKGQHWTVSLYTDKDIDVSEICKKYGGGGHKKAAGFQINTTDLTEMFGL